MSASDHLHPAQLSPEHHPPSPVLPPQTFRKTGRGWDTKHVETGEWNRKQRDLKDSAHWQNSTGSFRRKHTNPAYDTSGSPR